MAKMTIVGSGILGLSIAEFLSRKMYTGNNIHIISNQNRFAGSNAAAANLATKGQLFGRDKHFQLKLEGKKLYSNWITSLLNENNNNVPIDHIYRNGFGIDFFTSLENREKHYKRVKQSDILLSEKNLQTSSITKIEENKIMYEDESWVDAHFLLTILKNVLIKRGVSFYQSDFSIREYQNFLNNTEGSSIIFCTGAWTKNLLNELFIKLPIQMGKSERLTIGSTYFGKQILNNLDDKAVLHEIISHNLKEKVTFSGNENKQFISSSTLKLNNINEFETSNLELKNSDLLNLAKNNLNINEKNKLTRLDGFRVGYGHSEIILEKLEIPNEKLNAFVCAGAHKSGYLFAPVVGSMVQNLLLEN